MKTSIWKVIFIVVFSSALLSCVLDPDDQDTCGDSFTESEPNDSTTGYNDFRIFLRNGCKVTITGTISVSDGDDYFLINTGSASNISILVNWDSTPSPVKLYLRKQGGAIQESDTGKSNGSAGLTYSLVNKFSLRWVQVSVTAGPATRNYTLTINAFEP